MKKLLLAAALIASATTNAAELTKVDMIAFCGITDEVVQDQFKKYGEQPMLTANGIVTDKDDPNFPGTMVVWADPTSRKFSVTFTPNSNQGVTCYLVTGSNIEPYRE